MTNAPACGIMQNIHICYDLVGFIPVGTLEKQETA